MERFECDMCGACCRNIKNIELFKELDRGDGICKYLVGNVCSIYDDRPLYCRVDECYELFFSTQMSKEEFYNINYESCRILKALPRASWAAPNTEEEVPIGGRSSRPPAELEA